jgi:hypothetical protein
MDKVSTEVRDQDSVKDMFKSFENMKASSGFSSLNESEF